SSTLHTNTPSDLLLAKQAIVYFKTMAMINLSYFFISCSFFILFLHINSSLAALPTENDSGHYWNHNGLDECYSCYQFEPASWELQECLGQCSHLYKPTSFTPSLPTKDDWNQNGQACMMCGRLPPGAQEACMALCSHLYAQTTSSTPPSLPTTIKDDWNQNGQACMMCGRLPPGAQEACMALCSHLYAQTTSSTPPLLPTTTKDDWNQNGQACMMCGRLPPGAQEACMALCSHLYVQTTSSTPPSLPTTTKDSFNQNGDQCPLCYSLKDPNKVAACLHRCSHLYGRKMLILSVRTKE
ncbi:hypothetical protein AQUCO_06700038v1, partial [Aquilegia coerulea]